MARLSKEVNMKMHGHFDDAYFTRRVDVGD